jgi:hypothetical protein
VADDSLEAHVIDIEAPHVCISRKIQKARDSRGDSGPMGCFPPPHPAPLSRRGGLMGKAYILTLTLTHGGGLRPDPPRRLSAQRGHMPHQPCSPRRRDGECNVRVLCGQYHDGQPPRGWRPPLLSPPGKAAQPWRKACTRMLALSIFKPRSWAHPRPTHGGVRPFMRLSGVARRGQWHPRIPT